MEYRAQRLTREVQKHDPKLYVARHNGTLCVFRRTNRFELFDIDGATIVGVQDSPYFVCALTDSWSMAGNPVDWGIEPLMRKIRRSDLWTNEFQAEELIKNYEARDASKERDRIRKTEDMLYEMHGSFKKSMNDINTAGLAKKDRRYLDEKKMKLKGN